LAGLVDFEFVRFGKPPAAIFQAENSIAFETEAFVA
jgi:hypothetical protein